jgi:hypothetical protein
VTEFLRFVERAKVITRASAAAPPEENSLSLGVFKNFISAARPLVVDHVRHVLDPLVARAHLLSRWLVNHDLLAIGGFSFAENAYTELMNWALSPETHPPSAYERQRAWLQSLGIDEAIMGGKACQPSTQQGTDDGIPDLLLEYENGIVIVEAKTGTDEHETPSGTPQTISYVGAMRRLRGLDQSVPIEVVLICPELREPANPTARATTFARFSLTLAETLERDATLPAEDRFAFAMLITHFMTCAISADVPVRRVANEIAAWSRDPEWRTDAQVARRLKQLVAAADILLPEHQHE